MLKVTMAGRLGRNAEYRTTQSGTQICSFAVACDVGWGENKKTVWLDVAKFGKGAEGLSKILNKGDAVTVIGDLSTREHEGKTYLNCRADDVAFQGGQKGGGRGEQRQSYDGGASDPSNMHGGGGHNDLDDDIPF